MSTAPFDQIPEASIPANLQDGKAGDRVSVLETGLLYVRGEKASFAPWDNVYGVTELDRRLHVLAPRPLPAAPWFTVHAHMVRGGEAALPQLAARIRRGRPGGGGYRGAVRQHRARLSLDELIARVQERAPLPGALTVPVQNIMSSSDTRITGLQMFLFGATVMMAAGLYVALWVMPPNAALAALFIGAPLVAASLTGAIAGGVLARWVRRRIEPVRRVLFLAPDGCVVGLPTEVRALRWSDVSRFHVVKKVGGPILAIEGADGRRIGAVHSRFLGGPIRLIAAVANTYREAAHG